MATIAEYRRTRSIWNGASVKRCVRCGETKCVAEFSLIGPAEHHAQEVSH